MNRYEEYLVNKEFLDPRIGVTIWDSSYRVWVKIISSTPNRYGVEYNFDDDEGSTGPEFIDKMIDLYGVLWI